MLKSAEPKTPKKLRWRLGTWGWFTSFRPTHITSYSGDHDPANRLTIGFGTIPSVVNGVTVEESGEAIFVDLTDDEVICLMHIFTGHLDAKRRRRRNSRAVSVRQS